QGLTDFFYGHLQNLRDVRLFHQFGGNVVYQAFALCRLEGLLEEARVVCGDGETIDQFVGELPRVVIIGSDRNIPFDCSQHLPAQYDRDSNGHERWAELFDDLAGFDGASLQFRPVVGDPPACRCGWQDTTTTSSVIPPRFAEQLPV